MSEFPKGVGFHFLGGPVKKNTLHINTLANIFLVKFSEWLKGGEILGLRANFQVLGLKQSKLYDRSHCSSYKVK